MKKHLLLLVILILNFSSIFAQLEEKQNKEIYPETYTFEKAKEFEQKGEYDKAIWFYVNLFPTNKETVIQSVKEIIIKLEPDDIPLFIQKSNGKYCAFDPKITKMKDGILVMDRDELHIKSEWCCELIDLIMNDFKSINVATEFAHKGIENCKINNLKEGIADFNSSISILPSPPVYSNRGQAKSMLGDYKGAIEDYTKAIEFKFNLAESYSQRGFSKAQLKDYEGALQDFNKSIEIDKNYATAYNNRAIVYNLTSDYKSAMNDCDTALKIQPDFPEPLINRGIAKINMSNKDGACKDWEKAAALGSEQAEQLIKENCK